MEGYHVMATHPQLLPVQGLEGSAFAYRQMPPEVAPMSPYLTVLAKEMNERLTPAQFKEMNIYFMKVLNEGMAGMTHAKDIEVAEELRHIDLPEDLVQMTIEWRRQLNLAIMQSHKKKGMDIPDLNDVDAKRFATSVNFCFPHYFLLPTYGSASSYRIRPLGPEECLFELWSLTRFPEGTDRPPIKTPTPMSFNDPRWPPIPMQDFSNLPKQQRGLHTKGFEFMRLSHQVEGLISNYQRLIDGYLLNLGYDRLTPAAHKVSGCIDVGVADLGFSPTSTVR
jgi:glycine betaine catabolism A